MTTVNALEDILQQLVAGNLRQIAVILRASHKKLLEARKRLDVYCLGKEGLLRVLEDLRDGKVSPLAVQQWASFMRRGYVGQGRNEPIYPLDIEYSANAEDAIVDVISRLDELGDSIDGKIQTTEIENLIYLLVHKGIEG